jgi:tetratricopeptide (TPR) repeat protein
VKTSQLSIATFALFTTVLAPQTSFANIQEPQLTRPANPTYITQNNEAVRLWNSGKEKTRNGDHRGALADFDRGISLDPNYGNLYNDRAIIKENHLNDFQGALMDYNRALDLLPNDHVIHNNRGNLKVYKLNDFQGALADYSRAIAINSNYADAYNGRALLKENKLNDFQGALADYDRAIAINSNYADAYNNRAFLRRDRLSQRAAGLSDFNIALSLYRQAGDTAGVNRITTAIEQTPRDGVQNFRLVNRSSKAIQRVYISKSTDDNWGADRLGENQVIQPGNSHKFNFTGFTSCLFDIKVTFTGGSKAEKRQVDLCKVAVFNVDD